MKNAPSKAVGVRQRGKHTFEAKITRAILRDQLGIPDGTFTFTRSSKADAMSMRAAYIADLDAGIIPQAVLEYARQKGANQVTVGKMYQIMENDPHHHESTSTARLLAQVLPSFMDKDLTAIDRTELLQWVADMKKAQNSPGTIRKKVGALRTIFSYATNNDVIQKNVFDELPKDYSQHKNFMRKDATVKRDVERDRRLNEGEYEAIMEAIAEYRLDPRRKPLGAEFKPALRLMVDIAINTAMRLQEIFLLQWNHIDFKTGWIHIPSGNVKITRNTTKNKARPVPISSELMPLLIEHKKQFAVSDSGYVLPFFSYYDCNREKCSNAISQMWKRIVNFAELENLHFHDLRHEGVSRFVERSSFTLTQIMTYTGHEDSRIFSRYNNMRPIENGGQMY